MATSFSPADLPGRMANKIEIDEHGCWLWMGSLDKDGYAWGYEGTSRETGRSRRAHRLAYELLVGAIPDGMQIDHACHNDADCPGGPCSHRRCVNPAHLEPVTGKANKLRSPNTVNSKLAARTHCARAGHQRWGMKGGTRYCLDCACDYQARRSALRRADAGATRLAALVALVAVVLVTLGAATAGAQDWFKPTQADYVDLLATPYVPAPGHGDSIHATCAPGGAGVELAVHPFDEQPRSFQVWSTSPASLGGLMLVSEFTADYTTVQDFDWMAISYAGERFDLVSPEQQQALCAAPATTTPETSTTAPTASTAPPTTAPPVEAATTTSTGLPPVEVVSLCTADCGETGVSLLTQQRTLPATGISTVRALLLATALVVPGTLMVLLGRRLRWARRTQTRPLADHLTSTIHSHEDGQR